MTEATFVVINQPPANSNLPFPAPPSTTVCFLASQGAAGTPAQESVAAYVQGAPGAAELIIRYNVTNAITFSASLSRSSSEVASTGVSVFIIKNGASQVGTLTFGVGSTVGVFAFTAPAFAAGDVLSLTAPVVPDASLATFSLTLVGG